MERAGPLLVLRRRRRGDRRQGEQLPLDVAAQALGVGLLRVGGSNRLEDRQRVVQVTACRQRPRAGRASISPRRGSGSAISRATGAATVAAGAATRPALRARSTSERQSIWSLDAAKTASATMPAPRTRNAIRPPTDRDDRPAARGASSRCRRSERDAAARRRRGFEPVHPIEHRQRLFRRRAAVDRRLQQPARFVAVAAVERGDAVLQQLFRFALPLGQRAARALDVGAGARVAAIEKQRARPDVDRLLVLRGEVMVEADQQELLDLRVAIRIRRRRRSRASRRCEADRT